MIDLGLSSRDSRTLLVGIVIVGTMFGGARGVPALLTWERARTDAAVATLADLASDRAAVRMLPALRDSVRARATRLAARDSLLVSGASSAAAVAALASTLDDLAGAARITVTAIQLRADTGASPGLARVSVRLVGVTDVTGFAALLRTVEGGDAPLTVREVSVSQGEPMAPDAKADALRFEIVVESMARVQPSART